MSASYSVVIAAASIEKPLPVLDGLSKLPPKERPREIFACVGRNPSLQRNLGVSQCKAPVVYFLDDDSFVIPGTPTELLSHFEDTRTVVAGGPNLVPPHASSFEKTVNAVLASWLGSFKVRNRYASFGSVREATEKDLILCNMMVRRATFQAKKGFRRDLYPNEENEFLNRLLHEGFRLVYDPRGAVYRSRRKNLKDFCYQAFRYGRGRARQIKVYPCLSDLVHLVPFFFLVYLLTLPMPWLFDAAHCPWLTFLKTPFWWSPFILFSVLALGTGISTLSWNRRILDLFAVPFMILFRHVFYGIGLLAGFLTSIPRPADLAEIFRVSFSKKGPRFVKIKISIPRMSP